LDPTWEPPQKLYLTLAEASKLDVWAMALFFYYEARRSIALARSVVRSGFPVQGALL
jgi:hypothetical protein